MRCIWIMSLTLTSALVNMKMKRTRKMKAPRIFHGQDTLIGEFPFMGILNSVSSFFADGNSVYYRGGHCGASILSSRIVLTAAHCLVSDNLGSQSIVLPGNLQFVAGEADWTKNDGTEQYISIAGMILHEGYDSVTYANDIALLVTDEEIKFNDRVQPISLPDEADIEQLYAEGAPATVIGWGLTEAGGLSDTLKKLSYVIVSKSTCEDSWGPHYILPGMVCSGEPPMTEEHASSGDSGGPLFTKKKSGDWVQLGLVSWGPFDDKKHHTTWDVNSDVSYYKTWIINNIAASFRDYVTELTAENQGKSIIFTNFRAFLFKSIKILPATSSKYTTIAFKAGNLGEKITVMVYDGSSVNTDRQLVHLRGTITEQIVTATTSEGLTLVIMTEENETKSEGFTLEYSQAESPGESTKLLCANGYAACRDRYYCLQERLFCDSTDGYGECRDGSDEIQANCNALKSGTNNEETHTNSEEKDDRLKNDEAKEENSRSVPKNLSEIIVALELILCSLQHL